MERSFPGVPVYVMLPLDTIVVRVDASGRSTSVIQNEVALDIALRTLREAGVKGVMVDVWWGIVEREAPGTFDWGAYRLLVHKVASAGLRLQAVMSFHAAGGNVGDTCHVGLPPWVYAAGDADPDIFFTDAAGVRNRECVSLGADEEEVLCGATPLARYEAFVRAFCSEFQHLLGTVVKEITLGCGPAGEARYPAYPEGDRRWRFPGVGEFQCYDKYLLADLRATADAAGHPEWGRWGPHDAGHYCARAEHTGFFHPEWGSFRSPYGDFFLDWYSRQLLRHTEAMLALGARALADAQPRSRERGGAGSRRQLSLVDALRRHKARDSQRGGPRVHLGIKLAGVHWCYRTPSHAAELTAGYYNANGRDGYAPFFRAVAAVGGVASFTCVEMRDCEHPPDCAASPEGLLRQVIHNARAHGVPLTGENALQRYDNSGMHRIRDCALAEHRGGLSQLTFLRMGNLMFDHWASFTELVQELQPQVA